ncbi:MAG: class I SAM-dependent methyltransferase [Chloroflexota bacterium]
MPFRPRFDCLWCGVAWEARAPGDLEGWAQLCPACLGKAGTNPFLRGRLRAAIEERGAAAPGPQEAGQRPMPPPPPSATGPSPTRPQVTAPALAFPDDWFLRRGAFARGAIHDAAWQAELDAVTLWLDALPLAGRIVEPAAGVGFFSPLLAGKGELHATDADGDALDRARERLVAHRLRAHLHVADPWAAPGPGEPTADALVAAFLLGRVRGAGLDGAATTLRARLGPGGQLAVIDLRPDPAGGPPAGSAWTWHEPAILEAALARAGFANVEVRTTGRFFVLATAEAA